MTDNAQTSHMYGGFGHGGVTPNYNGIAEQGRPCNDFSQYGVPYSQYNQGNTRAGYNVGPALQKEGMVSNRHEMNWGSMNPFQPNCPPGQIQQRYQPTSGMPGLPQSQLPGSAPTLNQLLLSPNSDQRFSGMCSDYSGSKAAGPENSDHAGYGGVPHCGWTGQQRIGAGPYQQQMGSGPVASQTSPNQGAGMYEVNRRGNIGIGNRYPPLPGPLPPGLSSHHGSSSQNVPQYLGNMQPGLAAGQMQQQQQQSFSPNHSLVPPASHLQREVQPSPSTTPLSQQSDHSSNNVKTQSSPQSMPTTKQKSKKQQKLLQQSKPQMNAQESCVNDETESSTSHPPASGSGSSHQPFPGGPIPNAAPSPAGSVGSRSNTPASLSGNMVGSPSTNQLDGQSRILSPFHSHGSGSSGGIGSSATLGSSIHNLQHQQQMMPPPSMFPSHSGVAPSSSKGHVPLPPSPNMISIGSSQQMSAPPYNNLPYSGSHYQGSRGPPGFIPGYNVGHHELINGPHGSHLLNYGPGGMINRSAGYPGSFGNCLDNTGHFGGGYGVPPVGHSPSLPVSGVATSSGEPMGYHAAPTSGSSGDRGPGGMSGRMPSSVEDGSYSGRPVSSMTETPMSTSQRPSLPVSSAIDHIPHSSGHDGGPGRGQYGMPPPYEMPGLAQQHQHNMPMGFGKPFSHGVLGRPGSGTFSRDHNSSVCSDERSRPSSRNMDGGDIVSGRMSSLPGGSTGENSAFLKRPFDSVSYHGEGPLSIHYSQSPHVNDASSRETNVLPVIPGHHGQPFRGDDTLPVHPSMQTNMGPPASNPYLVAEQGNVFDGKGAQEINSEFTSAGSSTSSGFLKEKWMKPEQFQSSDLGMKSNITEREKPRIYDEGSTSDTQSSDLGATSLPADDLARFPGNLGQEGGWNSNNGSLLNKVLTASIDNGKKGKSTKSKKQKLEKGSVLVPPSPLTPDHDALDDLSNASRPTTPKSESNDILNKLIEMGDEPDRKIFLEQLFAFMEECRTPIISIPMISKTAIDLYKLYHLVREYGGMVEVTKNKKWRDVSGALNIGPSSSAGFTLKKNYSKHLFGFECRFDRGNVDPAPILAMLEQPAKKESKKAAAERAAAAAANTQDMYRMSTGSQFGCFPGSNVHLPNGIDPVCNSVLIPGAPHPMSYDGPVGIMRPPPGNMPNGGMIHHGMEGSIPSAHGMGTMAGGHGMIPPNCTGGDIINIQDPFSDVPNSGSGALLRPGMNYMNHSGSTAGMMTPRGMYGGVRNALDGRLPKAAFGSPVANKSSLSPPMPGVGSGIGAYEGSRSDLMDGRNRAVHDIPDVSQDSFQEYGDARGQASSGASGQRPGVETMHVATNRFEPLHQPQPLVMSTDKESAHHCPPPSDEQGSADTNFYGGMQASAIQHRPVPDQQIGFGHGGYPTGFLGSQRILPPPIGVERYYAPGTAGPPLLDAVGQPLYAGSPSVVLPSRYEMPGPVPHQRPMMKTEHRDAYNPCYDIRKDPPWMPSGGMTPNYPVGYPPNAMLHPPHGFSHSGQMGIPPQQKMDRSDRKIPVLPSKNEFHFPPDSVEAIQPRTVKRRRYTHKQLGSVDLWKLMMALKSGMIAESTHALEVLSILLHDDSTVMWFGLQHLPGLIEVLLEHFRHCLIQIFPNDFEDLELGLEKQDFMWDDKTSNESKDVVDIGQELDVKVKAEVDGAIDHKSLQIDGNVTKNRNGEVIVYEENSQEENLILDNKKWDVFQEIDSSLFDWQMGRGDTSAHILTHFAPETSIEFCEEKFFSKAHLSQITKSRMRNEEAIKRVQKSDCQSTDNRADTADNSEVVSSTLCGQTGDEIKLETVEKELTVVSDHDEDKLGSKLLDKSKTTDADEEVKALESMKRKWTEDEDIEISLPDDHSLLLVTESQTDVSRRCLSISNIFRGLSFVPSNDSEMSKHPGLLLIIGKLLTLYHTHMKQSHDSKRRNINATYNEKVDELLIDCDSKARWCSETLEVLREDTFVIIANISGQLDLSLFPEEIVSPILNGLLHWVTCSSACALDPLPTMPLLYSLSPRRLVLETLCKLCIADSNVDLLLAMPPYSRCVLFLSNLVQLVAESNDQVVREFAIVLISSLVQADSSAARAIALHRPSISILLDFIELADHRAVHVVNTQGLAMLKDSPEMMGTSLDMLRRAASILCHMAEVPENKTIFARYHHRLLHLVMSQIMDQKVATILAEVLYHSSLS